MVGAWSDFYQDDKQTLMLHHGMFLQPRFHAKLLATDLTHKPSCSPARHDWGLCCWVHGNGTYYVYCKKDQHLLA